MKKITFLLLAITFVNCSVNDQTTSDDNSDLGKYKIEYTSELSDSDLNLDISFIWNDKNGQLQTESTNIINPQVYSTLSDEKTVLIKNMIGVEFIHNSGGNYLSNIFVKVTNLDNNSHYEITAHNPLSYNGQNKLTIKFNTENDTFTYEYSTTN